MAERKYIYDFDFGGANDWVLASNIEEAKECHLKFTQCGDHDDVIIKRVPKTKWHIMQIINPETGNPVETFAEFAARYATPEFIASTEY